MIDKSDSRKHDVSALADMGAAMAAPHRAIDVDGIPYAVVPEGYALHELPTRQYPPRNRGNVVLHDVPSFVRFFNDHKTVMSRVYADEVAMRFVAVINDFPTEEHRANEAGDWRDFCASMGLAASHQWVKWTAVNRKRMSQREFAEFLQDVLSDVIQPMGGELLEMALNFETSSSGVFTAAQRLQDGSASLVFRADTQQVGQLKLPAEFKLLIPVFRGGPLEAITARLRFRIEGQSLAIWYELANVEDVTRVAFKAVFDLVAAGVGDVMLRGTP